METRAYCFFITFFRRDKAEKAFFASGKLGSISQLEDLGFEDLRKFYRKKALFYELYEHMVYIEDEDTLDSLNCRLNSIIGSINKSLGTVEKVTKYEPHIIDGFIDSWSVSLIVRFIEPIESAYYGIGLVCREREDEDFFVFFDEDGVLYSLKKGEKKVKMGDLVLFKVCSCEDPIVNNETDNKRPVEEIKKSDDEELSDISDLSDFLDIERFSLETPDNGELGGYYLWNDKLIRNDLSRFIDEEEHLQDERVWCRRESKPIKLILSPDYILFSDIHSSENDNGIKTTGFSYKYEWHEYYRFYISKENRYLYSTSYAETLLVRLFLSPALTESPLSGQQPFFETFAAINSRIDDINVKEVLHSYQVIVSDSKIINHSDERYRRINPSIQTDDDYIKSLFPLKEECYTWDYSPGDVELTLEHDTIKEDQAIKKAIKEYDNNKHRSFLLYEALRSSIEHVVLEREVNRYWPFYYYKRIVSTVPTKSLKSFIIEHNQHLLSYRDAVFSYTEPE